MTFDEGSLILQSEDTIYEDGGMQLLLEFNDNCFENLSYVDDNLDNILEEMYSDEEIQLFVIGIFGIIAFIALAAGIEIYGYSSKKKKLEAFVFSDHSLLTDDNLEPSKSIPIKDLYEFYYLAKKLDLIEDDSGLLEAVMIRCLSHQKIDYDNQSYIDLDQMVCENALDKELLMYLRQASKDKSQLGEKAFKKYCMEHYYNFEDWYDHVNTYMTHQYINMGKLSYEDLHDRFLYIHIHTKREVFDLNVKEDMKQVLALNKYLETCSQQELLAMDDPYYLILRSVLGLNDDLNDYDDYYYIYHLHGFVHTGVQAHHEAQ